jgi:hypothetical protein
MERRFARPMLVGLASTAVAFGAAAMTSAATAPNAYADDLTDIIAAVDGDLVAGQTAFSTAAADFASSNLPAGLAAFADGVDDDLLSAPNNLLVGTIESLTNEPIDNSVPWVLTAVPDFTTALDNASVEFSSGLAFLANSLTDLSSGEYGMAAYLDLFGADYVSIIPLEELLFGAAASF